MQIFNYNDMVKGWLVGNFEPSALKVSGFEVGVKKFNPGHKESKHYHKESIAVVMILDGTLIINGEVRKAGDILVVDKNESTELKSMTYSRILVVKVPSVPNDTYPGDPS